MSGADEVHVNGWPGTGLPFASRATALNCWVRPSAGSDAAAGLTSTRTTTCATVTLALPDTPAVVAVTVAGPFPTAVASPLASTVAPPTADDFQVNVRSGTELPRASLAMASKCCVSPRALRVAVAGLTSTATTTCKTPSVADPDTPAVVAVIVAVPLAIAVTRPVAGAAVATPGADDAQLKDWPRMALPFASLAVAVNCRVSPSASSVAVPGLTSIEVTSCTTDSVAVPATPAAVAPIVTEPIASPVASPVWSTLAIAGTDEAHVNACPATERPFPSSATALNCCVSPSALNVAVAGLTTTDVTTWLTVSVAAPETPPVVAVIVAGPFASAVTSPLGSTVAIRPSDDVQAKLCPGMTVPPASFATALNRCVSPSAVSVAVAGVTSTDAIACATESVAVPATPAAVAVMVADPIASPVARPVWSTLAIAGTDELQAKSCPATVLPFASFARALNCCARPTAPSVADAGATATDATTCATDSDAVPETPLAVAVIVAAPLPIAVARPVVGLTAATPPGDDVQVNVWPGTTFPPASRATALNCCVTPRAVSVRDAGVTITVATAWATDSAAVAETPPAVALMVTDPAARPIASPVWSMSATPGADDDHAKPCPGMTFPRASLATAVNRRVSVRAAMVPLAGLTRMPATTWATVTEAPPATPVAVAVMVAGPLPIAVASPVAGSTVATPGADDIQLNVWPGTTLPLASCATAPNAWVTPRAPSVAEGGETSTRASGPGDTAIAGSVDVTGIPPIVAVIVVALPARTPVNVAV